MVELSVPAWEHPATRRIWNKSRRIKRIWLVAGLVISGIAVVVSSSLDAQLQWLIDYGTITEGLVLGDPPMALRCGQVSVPVRFSVNGKERTQNVFVDGCGSGLRKGQHVEVIYNPADPTDLVVDRESTQEPLLVMVFVVALVVGPFFLGGAAIRGRRLRIIRRTAESYPWQDRTVQIASYSSPWIRSATVVRDIDDQDAPLRICKVGFGGATTDSAIVRCAGPSDGRIIVEHESVLGVASLVRAGSSRRRALRAIGSD